MRKRRKRRYFDMMSSVGPEIDCIKSEDSSVSDWLTLRVRHFKRQKFRIESKQSKNKTVSREVCRFISLFKDRFLIG